MKALLPVLFPALGCALGAALTAFSLAAAAWYFQNDQGELTVLLLGSSILLLLGILLLNFSCAKCKLQYEKHKGELFQLVQENRALMLIAGVLALLWGGANSLSALFALCLMVGKPFKENVFLISVFTLQLLLGLWVFGAGMKLRKAIKVPAT